jgi:hypothetical protein
LDGPIIKLEPDEVPAKSIRMVVDLRRTRSKVSRLQGIHAISSKCGEFLVKTRVLAAREAYKKFWLQVPSVIVALPAAYLVNTGPFRGTTL